MIKSQNRIPSEVVKPKNIAIRFCSTKHIPIDIAGTIAIIYGGKLN